MPNNQMADNEAFKAIRGDITSALAAVTQTTKDIANEDLLFHRSANPALAPLLDKQASRILSIAQALTKVSTAGTALGAPRLVDADSVEDNWQNIGDIIDNLLEKADACFDEYTGVIKRPSPSRVVQAPNNTPAQKVLARNSYISKPQLRFEKASPNDETPFKPLLSSKPHAVIPLAESLTPDVAEDGSTQYKHPYETEIKQSRYPPTVYIQSDPIPSLLLESTQPTLVDTFEGVKEMLEELKQENEIAVDLEHHDAHSFIGLVSLMQISTRKKDWIIDTLKAWREDLQILNEVFADPKIVKVFHGAFMDMIWLQRDLGLYVVGLFDTFHASECLGYQGKSLAALLKRFVNFDADKKFQRADWRIRPLPKDMFDYARCDTHFLLYIYDNMRNELIKSSNTSIPNGDLIFEVLERSKVESLQRYERPIYDAEHGQGPNGWYSLLFRNPAQFNREQFAVFRAVHHWRDQVARKEDEGPNTVFSKHVLFKIAGEMPMDRNSLFDCLRRSNLVMRSRMEELLEVIKQAKIAGATGPMFMELIPPVQKTPEIQKKTTEDRRHNTKIVNNTVSSIQAPPQSNIVFRTEISRFWGSTLENTTRLQHQKETQRQRENIRLAIPLPPLTAEVFENNKAPADALKQQSDPGAQAEIKYVKERKPKESDIFVVREVGGSRKRKLDDDVQKEAPVPVQYEPPTNSVIREENSRKRKLGEDDEQEKAPSVGVVGSVLHTDVSISNEDDEAGQDLSEFAEDVEENNEEEGDGAMKAKETRRARRQRKKARKLERKREELQLHQPLDTGETHNVESAFDYENAPSLLHPKPENVRKDAGSKKRPFDPYAKASNAPEGKRRRKQETGGRSVTFAH